MTSTPIRLAADLALPLNAVTQTFAFLARRGAGKTYGASKLAEQMLEHEAQIVVLDPVGSWWGLRLAADGKGKGFDIPVLGGLHGDIQLEAGAGALVADAIVKQGASVVLDVSMMRKGDRKKFATDFAEHLFQEKKRHRSPVHLFVEEAQVFCLTPDTEVLCDDGWRALPNVAPGDLAVAFDVASGQYAYETVERVVRLPFAGKLVHLKSESIDCAMTPDHRTVMRRFQHDPKRYRLYPWTVCEARSLPSAFLVPGGGAPEGGGVPLPDDILRVLGWIITDGYYHQRSKTRVLGLQQSVTTVKRGMRIVDEMRDVLKRLGAVGSYTRRAGVSHGPGGRSIRRAESVRFYLGAVLSRALTKILGKDIHRIPRALLELANRRQLEALYAGLMEGDGTARYGRWDRFFAGKNEPLADDMQELCTRLGIRSCKKFVPQNHQWTVSVRSTRDHWVRRRKTEDSYYEGDVWCLTVASGAFVARRNGTVFVTGNCPQMCGPDERRMLGAFEDIIKLGRNFGIGATLISQRPQAVNKDALSQTECLVVLQTNGAHERKAIEAWIVYHGLDSAKLAADLPGLPRGTAWVWSPSWLGITKKVQIAKKRTFDASATPEIGDTKKAKELAPIDLEGLRTAMADVVKKAEADDPKILRRRIAELERDVARTRAENPIVERVEVPVVPLAELRLVADALETFRASVSLNLEPFRERLESIARAAERVPSHNGAARASATVPKPRLEPRPSPRERATRQTAAPADASLAKGTAAVLTAIAQHGEDGVTREQLSVLTGYKRSTRDAYLQRLSIAGLVTLSSDRIVVSDAGLQALGSDFEPLPTGEALRNHWMDRLPPGEKVILGVLIDAYPKLVDRERLSELTEYARSSRDAYVQRLSARRLVEVVGRGELRASETLFQ